MYFYKCIQCTNSFQCLKYEVISIRITNFDYYFLLPFRKLACISYDFSVLTFSTPSHPCDLKNSPASFIIRVIPQIVKDSRTDCMGCLNSSLLASENSLPVGILYVVRSKSNAGSFSSGCSQVKKSVGVFRFLCLFKNSRANIVRGQIMLKINSAFHGTTNVAALGDLMFHT